MADAIPNPINPDKPLKRSLDHEQTEVAHPPQPIFPEDSAVTKAEKIERNGAKAVNDDTSLRENGMQDAKTIDHDSNDIEAPASKRVKVEHTNNVDAPMIDSRDKVKGVALVKPEYLIDTKPRDSRTAAIDDDAAEGRIDDRDNGDKGGKKNKKKKKEKGQNKSRQFGSWYDEIRLCNTRAHRPEFSPEECKFGDSCKCSHDLRQYLREGKNADLTTLGAKCPVWIKHGSCHAGWKCRFVGSHSKEMIRDDGRKELVLIDRNDAAKQDDDSEDRPGVYNVVSTAQKLDLSRRRYETKKADSYSKWLDVQAEEMNKIYQEKKDTPQDVRDENRANFTEPPFLHSEKRKIYFGSETPTLAPLTTQGNLPFRRLCVELGAQVTYSEMAMALPLIQGQKSEWALMKAHESELSPPRYKPTSIVQEYNNSKDLKFGVQISAGKPTHALKATEILSDMLPHLRLIDINCGCPIELVYQQGAGSGLLDTPSKLEKMVRGMNAVSGEIPITAKIRMGTRDGKPTATKLIERLAFGGYENRINGLGAPGCAALTLHGRSRQQRYTKSADWTYIAECAALIKSYNEKKDDLTDTIQEADERTQPNTKDNRMYFLGNGDCYSHVQYYDAINNSGVDSVMVARGALVKPWLFEEIESGQYLDKSATERLGYVEKFVRYGLEAWGSDEVGVGQTRRFLLEWLSFAHRYVPIGILAHLPPSLQDRPPAYRGRNEMENLLASDNYLDWIKISEMYLGPSHKDFKFMPKHKSNSYEIEAEG